MFWDAVRDEEDETECVIERHPKLLVQRNEAIRWYMTAAIGGHAGAQFRLGYSLVADDDGDEETIPVLESEKEDGVRWICKAALQGHREAMDLLTGVNDRLMEDDTVDTFFWSYPVAWETLHTLAKNNAVAAFFLASIYSLADPRRRNCEKAQVWLHKAAELGQPRAIEMIVEGLQLVPQSESTREIFPYQDEVIYDIYSLDDEEFDASVESTDRGLEFARLCGTMGSFVLDYQRMAELGHEEAAKRLAEMGHASTKAIVDMLRPVDQRPSSPKTS